MSPPPASTGLFFGLLFDPEDGGDTFPLKRHDFSELLGVPSQKTVNDSAEFTNFLMIMHPPPPSNKFQAQKRCAYERVYQLAMNQSRASYIKISIRKLILMTTTSLKDTDVYSNTGMSLSTNTEATECSFVSRQTQEISPLTGTLDTFS
jgi:hypothetical protein